LLINLDENSFIKYHQLNKKKQLPLDMDQEKAYLNHVKLLGIGPDPT